jgi:hypothetical protein
MITLDEARKIEYASSDGKAIQRVEFDWQGYAQKLFRLSLQTPKDADDVADLNVSSGWTED